MKKLTSKQKENIWYWIATVARLLLAVTFIFSGFVKAIDPLGTTYKIEDYLNAFGGWFTNFLPAAQPLAMAMIAFEFTLGVLLLFNVWIKFDSIMALLFMLVMTPLTLYLAIENPVTDCGCFGDAVVLTNWQTFWKNIVLLALVIILLIGKKYLRPRFVPMAEWCIFFIGVAGALGIMTYSLLHLPMIDFRPYKIGNVIREGMEIPDDAEEDEYSVTYIYEKDGVQQEFTLENYPKDDSTWTFVAQNSKLLKQGYVPPIHDFVIYSDLSGDITDEVLDDPGTTVFAVMYDLNKTNRKQAAKLNKIYYEAMQKGYKFYALSASTSDEVEAFIAETDAIYEICNMDGTQLKTIVRANPGVFVIKNGTIIDKYNVRQKNVEGISAPHILPQLQEEVVEIQDTLVDEAEDEDMYMMIE